MDLDVHGDDLHAQEGDRIDPRDHLSCGTPEGLRLAKPRAVVLSARTLYPGGPGGVTGMGVVPPYLGLKNSAQTAATSTPSPAAAMRASVAQNRRGLSARLISV